MEIFRFILAFVSIAYIGGLTILPFGAVIYRTYDRNRRYTKYVQDMSEANERAKIKQPIMSRDEWNRATGVIK
jgi:hypothetical protein